MRNAFSMIELVFVIIMIGVLATVAIPKLSVSRDDAMVSTIIANARIMVNHTQGYYTAQGNARWKDSKISEITNVPLFTDMKCTTPVSDSVNSTPNIFYICDTLGDDAINVVTFETSNEGNLTVTTKGGSLIADSVSSDITMIALANSIGVGKQHVLEGLMVMRN